STPQLINSLGRIAHDPIAAALPRIAWNVPDELHCGLQTLSLKTSTQLNTAVRLLEGLDMNHLANIVATLQNSSNPPPYNPTLDFDFDKPSAAGEDRPRLIQGPVVALHGLTVPSGQKRFHPQSTRALYCWVKEPRPFLNPFRTAVTEIFLHHGLVPIISEGETRSGPLVKLMNTDYLETHTPNFLKSRRRRMRYVKANFDASDLYPKYEDYPWTTEFPLEKLCLTEMGLKDVLLDGKVIKTSTYRDIASVPLPGVTESKVVPEHPDAKYVKAAKSMKRNHRGWPQIIPSTPPL
ncbi:MAG: hypothetical protein Q9191_008522, partial [Dirinaria sp. TL-2023a]